MSGREPRIQYATASDGARIAYWTLGEGPALVHMPPFPLSHIQAEWQYGPARAYWEGLSTGRRLIRYDGRGTGLSDREATEFSLDTLIADLEAVTGKLGLTKFALLGFGHTGPAAIAYAARLPERVSHLILWCSYARAAEYTRNPRVEAARSIAAQDWEMYTETEGYRASEWQGGEVARWYTSYLRKATTPELLERAFAATRTFDVLDLLRLVRAPTLVMHRREIRTVSIETARELAATIPDAHLAIVEGPWVAPFFGDVEAVVREIDSFLTEGAPSELPDGLTPREAEVLRLIAQGRSNREISTELVLSVRTVARHITNIYGKIGARGKADATAYAFRKRLV